MSRSHQKIQKRAQPSKEKKKSPKINHLGRITDKFLTKTFSTAFFRHSKTKQRIQVLPGKHARSNEDSNMFIRTNQNLHQDQLHVKIGHEDL